MSFLEQVRKLKDKGINFGSKLENEKRLNRPSTDMGLKRGKIMEELTKEADRRLNMPDMMKPMFRINSLDKQNNDPLKTGSIDSFRGATDIKPLPSQTFMGSRSPIIVPSNN
jgi:hypothetical protein